ncbi:MAG: hypothetical protein L6R28_21390 [Planctomycetes bacterium]|nr:hypothetical protein [Planctomycetota bacterium]
MTLNEMRAVIADVAYPGYEFSVRDDRGVPYLQGRYQEADIATGRAEWQHTRKWLLSEHMVKSEVVQTALKLILTSLEHRAREHFLYKGERCYGPHFDVDTLYEIAKEKKLAFRSPPGQPADAPREAAKTSDGEDR